MCTEHFNISSIHFRFSSFIKIHESSDRNVVPFKRDRKRNHNNSNEKKKKKKKKEEFNLRMKPPIFGCVVYWNV